MRGKLRVAEQHDGRWVVNQWLKQAVLLSFRINDNSVVDAGHTKFFDKVPQKFAQLRCRAIQAQRRARRAGRASSAAARMSRPTSC